MIAKYRTGDADNKLLKSIIIFLCLSLLQSCTPLGTHRDDFKKYFDEYGLEGCFELYDLQHAHFTDYNIDRCSQRFLPASTFKIFNALVGLQTGAVPGIDHIMKWDQVPRQEAWDEDQDMEQAIKNSTVWYFQEVARRIGPVKMQQYLSLLHYGNAEMGGAIDSFWLSGSLRISADEQIEFLKNFYLNTYHFSPAVVSDVKKMLIIDETPDYKLSGKTGWGLMHTGETGDSMINIGWFVGYLEKGNDVFFFAMNISAPQPAPENFAVARKAITISILKDLGLIPAH